MAGLTEARKLLHERFRAAINSHESRSLTPALELAKSLRSLNGGQQAVVDRLLKVISEHPATTDELRLAGILVAEMVNPRG
jgi:hypothetical protein